MEQQSEIWFRLGVTRHSQAAAIGGWQHHIQHLNRAQLFQYGARREPGRMRSETLFQRDDQAVGRHIDELRCHTNAISDFTNRPVEDGIDIEVVAGCDRVMSAGGEWQNGTRRSHNHFA